MNINDQQRVSIISEALPYLREFRGKTFVIKYGGSSMVNEEIKQKVIEDIALLHYAGVKVVLVHGGGPEINQMLDRLNIKSQFKDGLRITNQETMEIVEMILTGKVQKDLVAKLNKAGAKAIGICGKDANHMIAKKVEHPDIDLGLTGEIKKINPEILQVLMKEDYLPVISSIAPDSNFISHNINADNVASEVAIALKAEKLIFLTDTAGVLEDSNNPNSLIQKLNIEKALNLIDKGIINGGMIPKVKNSIECLNKGVHSVHILNGKYKHVLLLEIFTQSGVGTMISKNNK